MKRRLIATETLVLQIDAGNVMDRACEQQSFKEKYNEKVSFAQDQKELKFLGLTMRKDGQEKLTLRGH